MTQFKNSPFRATKRALPRQKYYYVSRTEKGHRVESCYETGHPMDDRHFEEGNYHLTENDAEYTIRWIEECKRWERWKVHYLAELREMKRKSKERELQAQEIAEA